MPDESEQSDQGQLASFSKSVTQPYEELKELKAAAEAVTNEVGSVVKYPLIFYYYYVLFKQNHDLFVQNSAFVTVQNWRLIFWPCRQDGWATTK